MNHLKFFLLVICETMYIHIRSYIHIMLHIYNCTLKKKQLHSKIVNLTQFKKNLLIKFKKNLLIKFKKKILIKFKKKIIFKFKILNSFRKKILIKFKKKKLIKYLFTHVNEEIEIVY